jgi:uncharacterized protein (TIGR03083 family)
MATLDHAAHLRDQNRLLGELIAASDPHLPVPTCPGWTLRQVGTHVGRGDRWAAALVEERAAGYLDPRTVSDGRPPAEPAQVAGWLADGVARLVDAVAATGSDTPVWTIVGPRPAAWWVRRRLHEATGHRADAALATGAPFALAPEVAADGVSEWLSLVTARPAADPPLDEGATLHLHATDEGLGEAGEWMVRRDGAVIGWEHGHGKGTVAVRGTATDLLLALLRRLPADDARLQVLGEPEVFTGWLRRTPFQPGAPRGRRP